MTPIKLYLILFCACLVKCNQTLESVYTDMYGGLIHKSVVPEVCANKICILKCCPKDTFVSYYFPNKCFNNQIVKRNNRNVGIDSDYSTVSVYSMDSAHKTIEKTSKNITEMTYYIMHGNIFQKNGSSTVALPLPNWYLLQDGSLAQYSPHKIRRYTIVKPLQFCVDLWMDPNTKKGQVVFKLLQPGPKITREQREGINKFLFTAITMLISCFFLLLTLLVYLLLPHLRTIGGKILMALASTLALSYLVKAVINLCVIANISINITCTWPATLFYFAILSSFFWMNVMSFNLFWTLRGIRKSREIHRRGENYKFIMYCLYAYGTPLFLTIIATVIDQADVSPDVIKPFFSICQNTNTELELYLVIPMGVLIVTNCLLFILTAYNIWLTKKQVNQNKDSRNTQQSGNNSGVYLKLSVVMGVFWILECLQFSVELPLWLYIIVNAYNVLIGVAIFFLFVFKKIILYKLCKKFNIKCKFVDNMQKVQNSRTETSRVPGSTKSNTSQKYDKSLECGENPLLTITETRNE